MSNQERSAVYLSDFQASAAALTARLQPGQDFSTLAEIPLELSKLKKALVEAADFLPRYDQRQVESQIKVLEANFEQRKSASAPKSRFSFKKKASPRVPPPPSSTPPATPSPAPVPAPTPPPRSPNDISIANLSHQVVHLPLLPSSSASSGFGLDLEGLSRCIIDLRPSTTDTETSLTALHVKDLKDCVLLAPLVRGSVMLSGCDGCLLILGGWQFRMHTSSHTEVFLFTSLDSSTPIIEGCSGLNFGPYILESYTEAPSDSSLPQPLDFSHPNPSIPSPNWSHMSSTRIEEASEALSSLGRSSTMDATELNATLDRLLSATR